MGSSHSKWKNAHLPLTMHISPSPSHMHLKHQFFQFHTHPMLSFSLLFLDLFFGMEGDHPSLPTPQKLSPQRLTLPCLNYLNRPDPSNNFFSTVILNGIYLLSSQSITWDYWSGLTIPPPSGFLPSRTFRQD